MRFVGFIAQRLVIKSEFRCGLGKILVLAMILIAMKCGCNVAHPSFLKSVGPPKEDIGLYLSHHNKHERNNNKFFFKSDRTL